MHPSYASNASVRANRSGVTHSTHATHPYSLPPVIAGQRHADHIPPHRQAIGTALRTDVRTEVGSEVRTGAGHALRHDLRQNIGTMIGARLAPRRAVAASQDLGTSDLSGMSATTSTRGNARDTSHTASSHTASHTASRTASHAASHTAQHTASYTTPHTAPHPLQPPDTDAASRLRERLLSEHGVSSSRTHAGRSARTPPVSSADISSPHRYRAFSEHCAMIVVAEQTRNLQHSAPFLASSLADLARALQSDVSHAQRLHTLRNFRPHSVRSHLLAQSRTISQSLMRDYLTARYLSDPVSNAETLAAELGERRTAIEQQLRMSSVYAHIQTLQHCLDLHGHVHQLREKCAVAFLHASASRQSTSPTDALTTISYAAVHAEVLQYQRFVFARDAVASATSRSLATVRMMGETDAPLHWGARAPNAHLPTPQARPRPESNAPSRPLHILSHQLTGQIFKMYAKRAGLVMLANKMGDSASPLETRLTYLQGFLGSVLPDAGQRVPTLIRIYAGLRYFSDPLCTPRVIASELGCEESVAQASLDNMHEYRQLRDLSALWNAPEDRLMLRERCAQSLLNAACDAQTSNERFHPDVPGSAYIAETTNLYRALNSILHDEQSFRDRQRAVIDYPTARLAQRR